MNKIFLSGNLTRDVDLKIAKNNLAVAKFGIAVKRTFTKNDETDFFNLTAFGKTAEFCGKYFSKGKRAIIEGRLQTNEYTDKDGFKRTGYEVIVDNIEFGESKKTETPQDDSEDLPF